MVYKIYEAPSRLATTWSMREYTWADFVKRLCQFQVTNERFADYQSMSKVEKGKIKDVGGFVAGMLKDGRRRNDCVLNRCMLTLDADTPCSDFLDRVKSLKFDYALYSTHSHSERSPRYRLCIPLSRTVSPDEYNAIIRKVAEGIDMRSFDASTFEPARLMYWSSRSIDAPYVFIEVSELGPLDPEDILKLYQNWKDCTQWPQHPDQGQIKHRLGTKAEDPLQKDNIIGQFCRCYTMHEAIDRFLPEVYAPAGPNRYTYKQGSTVAGLVIYDDKFAYSNHGTDPCCDRLLNAWDLVRIHLFGEYDEGIKPDTPMNKVPSFQKMVTFVGEDPKFHAAGIAEAFHDTEVDRESTKDLKLNSKGKIAETPANIEILLNADPNLKGLAYIDEFANKLRLSRSPVWRDHISASEVWGDVDDAGLRIYFEEKFGITSAKKISDTFLVWVEKNKRDPVKEYLEGLQWDGVPRLDQALVVLLGAEPTPYVEAATRKTFVAGVARTYEPGKKFDNMLVLVGPQGCGKSTFCKRMGLEKWHTDSIYTVQGKDAVEQIQGFWICEFAEIVALLNKKTTENEAKQFLSKQEDVYRPAYGRHTIVRPRRCLFIGTTNSETFLRDDTGNRRFWPIKCMVQEPLSDIFTRMDRALADQLWAEAKHYYEKGEPLYLPKELEQVARDIQSKHLEESPLTGTVRRYLEMKLPEGWENMDISQRYYYFQTYDEELSEGKPIEKVCAMQVWCEALGGNERSLDKTKAKEINGIIKNTKGWEYIEYPLKFGNYGPQRGFKRLHSMKK